MHTAIVITRRRSREEAKQVAAARRLTVVEMVKVTHHNQAIA